MKIKEFKEKKKGKIAYGLIVTIGIVFVGCAIVAFLFLGWYESLLRIGIIFSVGFVVVLYILLLPKDEEISEITIFIPTLIILVCSVTNTVVDAFKDYGMMLITLPVAIIGIMGTVFTILAIRELKEEEKKQQKIRKINF